MGHSGRHAVGLLTVREKEKKKTEEESVKCQVTTPLELYPSKKKEIFIADSVKFEIHKSSTNLDVLIKKEILH